MADEPEEGGESEVDRSLFTDLETADSDGTFPTEGDGFWYPTVDEIVEIHDEIIAEDDDSQSGIEDRDRIQFAIDYIRDGIMGKEPETVHEKAFALMRLIASNHWFVDGNKRTALNTTTLFYLLNGYDLTYGEDLRSMLKLLAVREDLINREVASQYLADQTEPLDMSTILGMALVSIADSFLEDMNAEDIVGDLIGGNGEAN
ncbi:type II toxin-antitoxin system death-on-curing family toxin [Halomicroarcula sp. GCM10025709]|uniref:type II toxin-antitoxin system death-on-curing family toxin n=1 Tax=Haloarcula TaxID=2237 RepID=UPI0024C3C96C|nr:type II toxin-antitoxin system death-on-curing family toxin [Halomicroarcula sp. YJ-61-S]